MLPVSARSAPRHGTRAARVVKKNPIPDSCRSFLNSARSTMLPMIRARNMTDVFSTPCNRARVTISPFAASPFRHRQGDECAAETANCGEDQQAAKAAAGQMHAKYALDDENRQREQGQYGQIGHEEQENALHEPLLGEKDRNIVTRLKYGRDVSPQIQAGRTRGRRPGNDHCTDTRGYMLVISRNNVSRVGHAI